MKNNYATVEYAGDDFFVAVTPSGHAQVLDVNGERSAASGPLELLMVALGGCTGADVISVLHKKREKVTAYKVEVRGERREEHPRRFPALRGETHRAREGNLRKSGRAGDPAIHRQILRCGRNRAAHRGDRYQLRDPGRTSVTTSFAVRRALPALPCCEDSGRP